MFAKLMAKLVNDVMALKVSFSGIDKKGMSQFSGRPQNNNKTAYHLYQHWLHVLKQMKQK